MTQSKQWEPLMNQKGQEKGTESVFHINVLHTKEKSPSCFLQRQFCKHFCWQHCWLRLWFPLNSFLFTPLHWSVKLSSKWDQATNLHYRQGNTTNSLPGPVLWSSSQAVILWTEAGTGKVEPSLPCCSQACQWKQRKSITGIGVTRLWEANKDAEKTTSVP